MDRKILYIASFVLSMACTVNAGDLLDGGPKLTPPADQNLHRKITGQVDRIESGMIFLKTEEGTVRNFGYKDAQKEGLKSIQPGDRVTLELDEGNAIADIHKEGAMANRGDAGTDSEGKGGAAQGDHHSIVGTVELFDPIQKKVTVKTDDDQSQSFEIKGSALGKLNGVEKGTKVTLEIDEQNRVMDAHRG
ncbi:MAG: hypothetical protein HY282_00130 [Nitrospirae bacterium]|nr:hypothetical protein [Candidatus Manganitrophaceae bacterium]